ASSSASARSSRDISRSDASGGTTSSSTTSARPWSAGGVGELTGLGTRSTSSSRRSRSPRARWSFHRQAARESRENRRDFARPVVETPGHEEATVHHLAGHRRTAPRRARDDHPNRELPMLS